MKSIFKKFIYSFLTFTVSQQSSLAKCILYEHLDSGYSITLNDNESIANVRGYMMERRTWHGHLGGWRGRDRNFNDEASSARVERGCTLKMGEHENFTGRRDELYTAPTNQEEYKYFDLHAINFADMLTPAECNCNQNTSDMYFSTRPKN